jgi:hypothetical protein
MNMPIYSRASQKTHVFSVFIAILASLPIITTCFGGTIGTSDSEIERLQQEVDAARNAFDAAALKPGVKLADPSVQSKAKDLQEKSKNYEQSVRAAQVPRPVVNSPPAPNTDDSRDEAQASMRKGGGPPPPPESESETPSNVNLPAPPPPRVEEPRGPETVLSGEGIQKEILYQKKAKPGKTEKPIPRLNSKIDHAEEPVPEETTKADAAGLSEIQYGKKKPSLTPAK